MTMCAPNSVRPKASTPSTSSSRSPTWDRHPCLSSQRRRPPPRAPKLQPTCPRISARGRRQPNRAFLQPLLLQPLLLSPPPPPPPAPGPPPHNDDPSRRLFLDFRSELARRMQEQWIGELESIRREKPYLDLVLTHVDDRFDSGMAGALGADAARVLPLLDRHTVTFLIEDPEIGRA